ncbi:MAG: GatB/YqeY domain-containing protein [Chitinophagales bacterium]
MNLEKKVQEAMKEAMKAKNQTSLRALRAIKSAILLAKTEKGASDELTEDKEIALLQKMMKQRNESIDIFVKQNREDLAVGEREEVAIIQEFLPAQLSEEEVKSIIADIVAKTGASSMKDMGKVMGMASKELAGRADNKIVSQIVKNLLA